jgi:nickel-dependent lactate racemase
MMAVLHGRGGANGVQLHTHEWFGDKLEYFEFPDGWRLSTQHMKGYMAPVLSPSEIQRAVQNPAGTKPLRELATGKRTVTIAFDDLTRPTPTYAVVPHVMAELHAAGIRDEDVLFVAAYGSHHPMNGIEVAKKLGQEAVFRYSWINHNCWQNLTDLGTTKARNQLWVSSFFLRSDLKITLSGVKAHPDSAGYSGGPKLVLPGICGISTIRYMHEVIPRPAREKRSDGTEIIHVWQNERHQDMIDAARKVGIDFSVQIVYNQDRQPVCIVAGDVVKAHHQACRYAVNHLATETARPSDVVVVNVYPKGQHVQEHLMWGLQGLKDGGSVVVVNQSPMGEAAMCYLWEAGFDQGAPWLNLRNGRKRRFPMARQVLIYSQYLQKRELDHPFFPPEAIGVRRWSEVIERLKREHKGDVDVAIYPYAGIQQPLATLDLPEDA